MGIKVRKVYGQTHTMVPTKRLRKFGVPPGGPLDPYTCNIARSSLLRPYDSPMIEVKGTLEFEATRAMTICWMTPFGGYTKPMKKFEIQRVCCLGEFAGYLGFTYEILPERGLVGLFEPMKQLRFLPIHHRLPFDVRTTMDISRMGFRCDSSLTGVPAHDVSEPICPGMLQLTPSGQVIIIGPDGPVTGGYHKLGVVIEADLPFLATMLPLTEYEFIPVNMEEALSARKELHLEAKKRQKLIEIVQARTSDPIRYQRLIAEYRK